MLKNKCSVWKRIKFPTFWYNCYYFTWSDTYFIQLETLLINHPSYNLDNRRTTSAYKVIALPLHVTSSECKYGNGIRKTVLNQRKPSALPKSKQTADYDFWCVLVFGMWRYAVWHFGIRKSQRNLQDTFVWGLLIDNDDGRKSLGPVGTLLTHYTGSHPERQLSSWSQSWT